MLDGNRFARIVSKESKLANQSKRALLEANRRLTPEQRLESYVVQCRLVMDLSAAGQRARAARAQVAALKKALARP